MRAPDLEPPVGSGRTDQWVSTDRQYDPIDPNQMDSAAEQKPLFEVDDHVGLPHGTKVSDPRRSR